MQVSGVHPCADASRNSPKVIGHIDPCRAQFTILSNDDKTYSTRGKASGGTPGTGGRRRTSLVLWRLETELVGVELCELCDGLGRGRRGSARNFGAGGLGGV